MRPPLSYIPLLPVLLFVVSAILVARYIIPDRLPELHDESRSYSGLVEEVTQSNSGQHMKVSVKDLHPYRLRITVPSLSKKFLPGDSVTFHSKLTEPQVYDRYCNNLKDNLLRYNIYAQSFVIPDSISVTGSNKSIYWKIKRLQPELARLIKEAPLSSDAVEFLCAALLGDDSLITDRTRTIFSGAGVAHILALSGLHVGIIALLISIVLFPLYLLRLRKVLIMAIILLLWVYAILTGLSSSVTRAVIMSTTVGIGIVLQRRNFSLNAMLLAAIIILIADPDALFQVGFQLSFCSVTCILLAVPIIDRLPLSGIPRYIASLILVTVAATAGSGLIAAYYFHSFPVFFIFANIPVLMLLPVLMGAGILVVIAQLCSCSPSWLYRFTDVIYNLIYEYVGTVTTLPHATVNNIFFSAWVFIPYVLFIGLLFAAIHYRNKKASYSAIGFCAATVIMALISAPPLNAEEYFIVHSFRDTTILYRQHNKITLYTTAQPRNAVNIKEKVTANYSEYIMRHNVDSIDTQSPGDGIVSLKDCRILLLHTNDTTTHDSGDISHVVICRGFSGNPLQVKKRFPASRIILSRDLHPRRHNRYIDSLNKYDIPFHSLRTDFDAEIFNMASK